MTKLDMLLSVASDNSIAVSALAFFIGVKASQNGGDLDGFLVWFSNMAAHAKKLHDVGEIRSKFIPRVGAAHAH